MVKTQIDVKRAIMESGMSMADVAEATGIDRSNISKLWTKVNGEDANPTLKKLLVVANAIGKDITELFYPVDGESKEVVAQTVASPADQQAEVKVGMIMCPHCHCGFEITGVVTPPTE